MVVRRDCFEALGGFDPGYFMYWEDADLCARARSLGWDVRVLPCEPFVHFGSGSSEGTGDADRWAWYVDGARRFGRRHLSPARAGRILVALRLARWLRSAVTRR